MFYMYGHEYITISFKSPSIQLEHGNYCTSPMSPMSPALPCTTILINSIASSFLSFLPLYSVLKYLSPKSPRPGTMNFLLFSSLSMAPVMIFTFGNALTTFKMPVGHDTTVRNVMFSCGTPASIIF